MYVSPPPPVAVHAATARRAPAVQAAIVPARGANLMTETQRPETARVASLDSESRGRPRMVPRISAKVPQR